MQESPQLEHVVRSLVSVIRRDTGPGFMTSEETLYVIQRIREELESEIETIQSDIDDGS